MFPVICSTCSSRPASSCAQSVDPDVTTVPPAGDVYDPSIAWPAEIRRIASGSRDPNTLDARNSISDGSCGFGGLAAVALVADGGRRSSEHVAVVEAGAVEHPVVGSVHRVPTGAVGGPLADAVVAAPREKLTPVMWFSGRPIR